MPASIYTRSTLRDRVRGDLGLRAANFLTDADINNWGLEAQNLLARETRWNRGNTFIDTVAGTQEYAFPVELVAVEEVNYNQAGGAGGIPIYLVTISELYNYNPYWRRTGQGNPLFYYIHGNSAIGLHPTPSISVVQGLQLIYTLLPTFPAGDNDFYQIPYGGDDAIVNYCKLLASEKDAAGEGGKRIPLLQAKWEESLRKLKWAVESTSESEACVVGADAEGESGIFRRVWGFDANQPITGPP